MPRPHQKQQVPFIIILLLVILVLIVTTRTHNEINYCKNNHPSNSFRLVIALSPIYSIGSTLLTTTICSTTSRSSHCNSRMGNALASPNYSRKRYHTTTTTAAGAACTGRNIRHNNNDNDHNNFAFLIPHKNHNKRRSTTTKKSTTATSMSVEPLSEPMNDDDTDGIIVNGSNHTNNNNMYNNNNNETNFVLSSNKRQKRTSSTTSLSSSSSFGQLELLKQQEQQLLTLLREVRMKKIVTIKNHPLTIGIVGFGRFGQFITETFVQYASSVLVTSRTNYTTTIQTNPKLTSKQNVHYLSMDQLYEFVSKVDVIVVATSILSFESTIQTLAPYIQQSINERKKQQKQQQQPMNDGEYNNNNNVPLLLAPLVVDVCSVKEHAKQIMIQYLPNECDILCTHPMFGPDSGKNGWNHLNFVYEKTRIHTNYYNKDDTTTSTSTTTTNNDHNLVAANDMNDNDKHNHAIEIACMDRMERFLSIWEEEGCTMVPMSCVDHDMYAANSQFITHLIGRVLARQQLISTPIDTNGFQSILRLIQNTNSDSFDLFYGLYKYNQKNSNETIVQLQAAMNEVVTNLQQHEHDSSRSIVNTSTNSTISSTMNVVGGDATTTATSYTSSTGSTNTGATTTTKEIYK